MLFQNLKDAGVQNQRMQTKADDLPDVWFSKRWVNSNLALPEHHAGWILSQDLNRSSYLSWERLKLHRSHDGLFSAPKESGRGQALASSDLFILRAGESLSLQLVG